jgi:molecular chaperone DnaK (HSP70)
MSIKVAEGERSPFSGNTFLDSFEYENLPLGRAGDVFVVVTFEVNKSGLMLVKATETSKRVTKSKEMRNEGNYYKVNEKEEIKQWFIELIQKIPIIRFKRKH